MMRNAIETAEFLLEGFGQRIASKAKAQTLEDTVAEMDLQGAIARFINKWCKYYPFNKKTQTHASDPKWNLHDLRCIFFKFLDIPVEDEFRTMIKKAKDGSAKLCLGIRRVSKANYYGAPTKVISNVKLTPQELELFDKHYLVEDEIRIVYDENGNETHPKVYKGLMSICTEDLIYVYVRLYTGVFKESLKANVKAGMIKKDYTEAALVKELNEYTKSTD